jgi:hypothetical protein
LGRLAVLAEHRSDPRIGQPDRPAVLLGETGSEPEAGVGDGNERAVGREPAREPPKSGLLTRSAAAAKLEVAEARFRPPAGTR